jgi:hypothetical protein
MHDIIRGFHRPKMLQDLKVFLRLYVKLHSQDNRPRHPPHPLTGLTFPERLLNGMLIQNAMRIFPLFPKILQVIISGLLIGLTNRSLSNSYRSFGLFQPGYESVVSCRREIEMWRIHKRRWPYIATVLDTAV